MDCSPTKGQETVIDIESCIETIQELEPPSISDDSIENLVSITICGVPISVDESLSTISINNNSRNVDDKANNNKNKREKRKPMAAKKPFSKPPRPPKGLSLDASDQKLVNEISELVMIKRARTERMKALKKMKAAKALSTSSSANLIAMAFTIFFCVVIIFQGCHSSGISRGNKPSTLYEGSEELKGAPLTSVEYPNLVKLIPVSESKDEAKKVIR